MNYGIIIIVMALDLNMWQTQMFYDPFKYAQYTGPDGRVFISVHILQCIYLFFLFEEIVDHELLTLLFIIVDLQC